MITLSTAIGAPLASALITCFFDQARIVLLVWLSTVWRILRGDLHVLLPLMARTFSLTTYFRIIHVLKNIAFSLKKQFHLYNQLFMTVKTQQAKTRVWCLLMHKQSDMRWLLR